MDKTIQKMGTILAAREVDVSANEIKNKKADERQAVMSLLKRFNTLKANSSINTELVNTLTAYLSQKIGKIGEQIPNVLSKDLEVFDTTQNSITQESKSADVKKLLAKATTEFDKDVSTLLDDAVKSGAITEKDKTNLLSQVYNIKTQKIQSINEKLVHVLQKEQATRKSANAGKTDEELLNELAGKLSDADKQTLQQVIYAAKAAGESAEKTRAQQFLNLIVSELKEGREILEIKDCFGVEGSKKLNAILNGGTADVVLNKEQQGIVKQYKEFCGSQCELSRDNIQKFFNFNDMPWKDFKRSLCSVGDGISVQCDESMNDAVKQMCKLLDHSYKDSDLEVVANFCSDFAPGKEYDKQKYNKQNSDVYDKTIGGLVGNLKISNHAKKYLNEAIESWKKDSSGAALAEIYAQNVLMDLCLELEKQQKDLGKQLLFCPYQFFDMDVCRGAVNMSVDAVKNKVNKIETAKYTKYENGVGIVNDEASLRKRGINFCKSANQSAYNIYSAKFYVEANQNRLGVDVENYHIDSNGEITIPVVYNMPMAFRLEYEVNQEGKLEFTKDAGFTTAVFVNGTQEVVKKQWQTAETCKIEIRDIIPAAKQQ